MQYAALPYRVRRDGEVQIRLITSRETRRWVIPKGWPIKGLTPPKTAARETYEEAGLVGVVGREPLGLYTYEKRLGTRSVLCDVLVFPLKVKRSLQKWPERFQRYGFWFSIDTAAAAVQEEDLSQLIRAFGDLMARRWAAKLEEKTAGRGKAAAAPASADDAGGATQAAASTKKRAKAKGKGAVEAPGAAASGSGSADASDAGAAGAAEAAAGVIAQPDRAKKAGAKDGKAKTIKAKGAKMGEAGAGSGKVSGAKAKAVPAVPTVVASGAGADAALAGRQDGAGPVPSVEPEEDELAPAEGKAPKPKALKSGVGKPVDGKSGAGKSEVGKSGASKSGGGKSGAGKSSASKSNASKSSAGKLNGGASNGGKAGPGKAGSGKSEAAAVAVLDMAGVGQPLSGAPELPMPPEANGKSTKASSGKTYSDKSAAAKAGSGKTSSSKAKPKKTGPGKA